VLGHKELPPVAAMNSLPSCITDLLPLFHDDPLHFIQLGSVRSNHAVQSRVHFMICNRVVAAQKKKKEKKVRTQTHRTNTPYNTPQPTTYIVPIHGPFP